MRIGLAIYNFDPKKGGAERYGYDLARNLTARGHEIYVFCNRGVATEGITLIPVSTLPYPRWLRTLSFAVNQKKISKSVRLDVALGFGNTFNPDVYQSHGGIQRVWMEREVASYDDPRERNRKAFLLKNNINQKIQQYIAEFPVKRKTCSRIVAISHMVRKDMSQYYGIEPHHIDIVYNGVDTVRFNPAYPRREGRLRILFSAGNFRLKGLSPLLNALGKISEKRRDFRLIVMGRGKRKRYEKLMDTLNIVDLVTFLGEQSSPESAYREAHTLIHPTFYDACSLTTMEAMACGLPVVSTKWNGSSALISENEGFVIDEPRNIPALTSAIIPFFDEERRSTMGRNARAKLESYTIEKNAGEMERILSEAAH